MKTNEKKITPVNRTQILNLGRQTLAIEAQAVSALQNRLGESFVSAVECILKIQGRVVVMGMGKSGHIGTKIAATLASTGTPSMFVHPGEASHGDLGMITPQDVVLALSNSGETEEITRLLPLIKRLGVSLIAITGGENSTLGSQATLCIDSSVEKEACPLNLAPTASTTAQLAIGDALAVALLDARGFKSADFAASHPAGALGRRLLTHVSDIMRTQDQVPSVVPEMGMSDLLQEMSKKGLGATAIVDSKGVPIGIFTDGDLRRLIEKGVSLKDLKAADVMRSGPKTITENALAVDVVGIMEERSINTLLVVNSDGVLCGALNTNDLMRAKVI
jgi:arabinose-5-phosphate isomerase